MIMLAFLIAKTQITLFQAIILNIFFLNNFFKQLVNFLFLISFNSL